MNEIKVEIMSKLIAGMFSNSNITDIDDVYNIDTGRTPPTKFRQQIILTASKMADLIIEECKQKNDEVE